MSIYSTTTKQNKTTGGAGTTAAGLRYGLPNFICPFFGDQYMWGAMVHRAGVGPEPCPVDDLTSEILVGKLLELTSIEIKQKASELAMEMNEEDGVLSGLDHFCHSLPRDSMMCDVSLIMGESTLAKYHTCQSRINISKEVAAVMVTKPIEFVVPFDFKNNLRILSKKIRRKFLTFDPNQKELFVPHGTTTYALSGGHHKVHRSIAGACSESLRIFLKGLFQCCLRPDKFARLYGCCGCLCGCLCFPFYTIWYWFEAIFVYIDRLGVAIANNCFNKQWLYMIDSSVQANVYQSPTDSIDNLVLMHANLEEKRIIEIKHGLQIGRSAMSIFDTCEPKFRNGHWHWKEVPIQTLRSVLMNTRGRNGQTKLGLTTTEFTTLINRFDRYEQQQQQQQREISDDDDDDEDDNEHKQNFISSSRFCLFIGEAVHERFNKTTVSEEMYFDGEEIVESNSHIERISTDPRHITITVPIGGADDDDNDNNN